MARTPKEITDGELAVMKLLWKQGRLTTQDLINGLYSNNDRSHYEVLQGLLRRLEQKGFVTRDRKSLPHHFKPSIAQDALIGRHLKSIADKLCGGAIEPLLKQLVNGRLTSSQLVTIRNILNERSRD